MPRENDSPKVGSEVERAVMLVLPDGRPLLTRTELVREVTGAKRDEVAGVEDAIEGLLAFGLIHMIEGQFLFASQAARRADWLGL